MAETRHNVNSRVSPYTCNDPTQRQRKYGKLHPMEGIEPTMTERFVRKIVIFIKRRFS